MSCGRPCGGSSLYHHLGMTVERAAGYPQRSPGYPHRVQHPVQRPRRQYWRSPHLPQPLLLEVLPSTCEEDPEEQMTRHLVWCSGWHPSDGLHPWPLRDREQATRYAKDGAPADSHGECSSWTMYALAGLEGGSVSTATRTRKPLTLQRRAARRRGDRRRSPGEMPRRVA